LESEQRDLVSFAMQIVKKRMLSSRLALTRTIENRLEALKAKVEEPEPTRAELRELEGDLPLPDHLADRLTTRILRSAVPRDTRRRNAERRQLQKIRKALQRIADRPDPKITRLLAHLRSAVIDASGEKAIVFTEYRDTLEAIRDALNADPAFEGRVVELAGGLTQRQRRDRIAAFATPECRVLLATDAASEGLNLQHHCRRLYHVELPWNPNRLEQRNGRIDRYAQRRTPQIAYFFYADSPEDRILDRLVLRISQMQDDRVSTPDIIGVIEATRLPDRLLSLGLNDNVEEAAASLERVFAEEREGFARELAPLLSAGDLSDESFDATSADPVLDDDLELEPAIRRLLGENMQPTGRDGEYRLTVPIELQGPGVADRYPAATFRRSIALADGMDSTEFIHRLHPLVRAGATRARDQLRAGSPGLTVPPCVAVRRLAGLQRPVAVFTFLDRSAHPDGALVAVGVLSDGTELPDAEVTLALGASDRPGEVAWAECERAFSGIYGDLRDRTAQLVLRRLTDRARAERERRARVAHELRREVQAYRADRVRELEREESAERAGAREQAELFREVRTDWAARRAAVATQADARLAQIAAWERVPDPETPDPLGVLLLFPGEER
jgi:hypothetical protein